jgi:hypothetical protein
VDASFSDPDHGCVVVEELSLSATKLVGLTTNDGGTAWNVADADHEVTQLATDEFPLEESS